MTVTGKGVSGFTFRKKGFTETAQEKEGNIKI